MYPALYLLLGLVIGVGIGWLARSRRQPSADSRIETELREQVRQREGELVSLRQSLNEAVGARAAAETGRAAAEQTVAEMRQVQVQSTEAAQQKHLRLETELAALRDRLGQSSAELATAAAQLGAERKAVADLRAEREMLTQQRVQRDEEVALLQKRTAEMDERIRFLNERLATERQQIATMQEKFSRDFEAISNKLLVDSSTKFNQQSSESLEKLLAPLRENLTHFKTSLDVTRQEAATHSALLKEQVSKIGSEAANLAKALKGDAKVLGNWGENMLDQLLSKSGLQRDVHYRRQHSGKDGEGDQRYLDVVIDLPEKRHLVIDSKVSLRAFEEAFNCTDDVARAEHLGRHVDATRKHFRDLGRKRYHETIGINAPDFVLMYVPIEAAYLSAIAQVPTLFEEALEQGVVLVTNSTLLPTLRTVANVWRLADQQKNAIEIAERGGRLYDKFVGFVEDLKKVGDALNTGQEAWQAATNKLHGGPGNLVRQAEQLKSLGAKASKALPAALVEKAGPGELTVAVGELPPAPLTRSAGAN